MAIKSRDDLMNVLNNILGERNDDASLELLQDFADTFDDLSSHTGTYTQEQYDALDASWRKRYKDRFFAGATDEGDDEFVTPVSHQKPEPKREETITIKDLFKPKE